MVKYIVNEQVVEYGAHGIVGVALTDTLGTFDNFKDAQDLFNDRKAQAPKKLHMYDKGVHVTLEELQCDKDGDPQEFTIHGQYYGKEHE